MWDVGTTVAGHRLLDSLGRGPFGRTFVAQSPHGRRVAVKLLKPSFLDRPDGMQAFDRLVASIAVHARIGHPYLAQVYGALHDDNLRAQGQVVELVPGSPLSQLQVAPDTIRGRHPKGLASLLGCFEQLGSVLHWLHMQGMVHGNLKPGNVALVSVGQERYAKLLDLSWSAIGVAAVAPGPASYVSPEQYRGAVPTPASDQWALATLLERIFTRGQHRLAFGALPAALVQAVHRATADDPAARYPDVGTWVESLCQIRADLLQSVGEAEGSDVADATQPAASVPFGLAAASRPELRGTLPMDPVAFAPALARDPSELSSPFGRAAPPDPNADPERVTRRVALGPVESWDGGEATLPGDAPSGAATPWSAPAPRPMVGRETGEDFASADGPIRRHGLGDVLGERPHGDDRASAPDAAASRRSPTVRSSGESLAPAGQKPSPSVGLGPPEEPPPPPPVEPAPSPVWLPRIAAVLVVLAAGAVGTWRVWKNPDGRQVLAAVLGDSGAWLTGAEPVAPPEPGTKTATTGTYGATVAPSLVDPEPPEPQGAPPPKAKKASKPVRRAGSGS